MLATNSVEPGGGTAVQASQARPPWSFRQRIAFRFVCAYLLLYNLPFPIGTIPGTERLSELYEKPWKALATWLATDVFRLAQPLFVDQSGSGDRTYDYLLFLSCLAVAIVVTVVWSALDRRRGDYRAAHAGLRVYVRYVLASTMLSYGMSKVFKSQFPIPGPSVLLQSYGQSSPMRLLWTFMGFSKSYTFFAGSAEVLGGLLLFSRRTTTLGALIVTGVMVNVAMMNFSYDVPVKLYSVHLLLQAMFLVAPDGRRLIRFFILNRDTEPVPLERHRFPHRWTNRVVAALKVTAVGGLLYLTTSQGFEGYRTWGDGAPRPPLFGLWEVATFTRGGEAVPPISGDSSRWRSVGIGMAGSCLVKRMDDSSERFRVAQDDRAKTLTFTSRTDSSKVVLSYSRPTPERLLVRGSIAGVAVEMELKRAALSEVPLLSRGFHWINEVPYNR
jgi:uncharacterized membrane protein YphA (DoxX/SURF4 family)